MPVCELAAATWEEVRDLDPPPSVAILPIGAIEAHGPHLPLDTDVIIAEAMAREGARRLAEEGRTVLILPPVAYTPAPFAAEFSGTIGVRPETLRALVADVAATLARGGGRGGGESARQAPDAPAPLLVLANAHLDPAHVRVLRGLAAAGEGDAPSAGPSGERPRAPIVFPDVTRRRLAERLTDEFRSGACHAGRYETSVVLAAAPGRVREGRWEDLPPVPHSLSDAIREGKGTFGEAGGERAYFGDPAGASAEEGRETIGALGRILAEAVREAEGRR